MKRISCNNIVRSQFHQLWRCEYWNFSDTNFLAISASIENENWDLGEIMAQFWCTYKQSHVKSYKNKHENN